MNWTSYEKFILVHLYQPDIEVPCYPMGYIPFFYLELYPENAHRIKFVQYIQVCMCICREMNTQTIFMCVCVCIHTPYIYYTIVHVYMHAVCLQ